MDFQTFHKYNRLVARGVTKPLTCQHCHGTLVLGIDKDTDGPVLICYFCSVTVYPGLKMFRNIQSVVKEFYLD